MKQKLTTGMLFIGTVLLGAFIWFFEYDLETSPQQKQRNRTLFAIRPEQINSIVLERNGAQIECSKASGSWRLIHPVDAPVDQGVVEKMIGGLARVKRGELIPLETLEERDLTPADYGMDEPRARITFQDNRGTFTWLIGRNATLGDRLYIMPKGGGELITAPQTLLHLIPEDPVWIRARTLFRDDVVPIRGIDLRRPNGFMQLRQLEGNEWVMQQPYKGPADLLKIYGLIEQIRSTSIEEFITDEKTDLTAYDLAEPTYELTIFTQDEQTQTVRFGKPNPDQPQVRYAKHIENDSVFTTSTDLDRLFEMEAKQFRSRQLLGILPSRITQIQLTQNEQQLDMMQTNGVWKITRPDRWKAEPSSIRELLQTISQTPILDFIDHPTAEEALLITHAPWTLTFTADGETQSWRISKETSEKSRIIQRNKEPSLYIVDAGLMNETFANPLFFRNRTVLQMDPTHIEKITLHTPEEEFCVHHLENELTPTDRSQQIDDKAISELTSALMNLRATRYVAFNPNSLEPYGLSEPTTRLAVTLNETNTLGRVILFGEKIGENRFAMLQGQKIVFVLSKETVQALTRRLTQPREKQTAEIE